MAKVMLINVTHAEESRVAIVEDGLLDTFEIETLTKESIKGNLYNAVVEGVNNTLNAAFLRYSNDRPGFLPMDEVNFRNVPLLKGVESESHRPQIRDRLTKGMKIPVQVIKDGFSTKPASLTTYYSLPGRYLVLMPGSDSAGISRKIEDNEQRDRLRKIVDELKVPDGFGVIVRTAGFDVSRAELQRDLKYLLRLWENVVRVTKKQAAPSLVYQERDLVIRTIRDYFTHDIREIHIDSKEVYDRARLFFQEVMPSKKRIVKLYREDRPIFTRYNLEDQIESIYKRRVALRSGGEIVIDGTEALTSIDVNSAKSKRESNIEDMATSTNIEAAEEIGRQLRIRDIGGLVVVDFIDMRAPKNNRAVEKALKDAMKRDKAKYDVTRISRLGLMEISRQRLKTEKAAGSYVSCPVCGGHGLVRTTESAALATLRKIHARVPRGDLSAVTVTVPPEVALYLLNHKREDLAALERRYKTKISVKPEPTMRPHQSEIELTTREGGSGKLEATKDAGVPEAQRAKPRGRGEVSGRPEESPSARRETPTRAQESSSAGSGSAPESGPAESQGAFYPGASKRTNSDGSEPRRRRRRRRRRPAGRDTERISPEAPGADEPRPGLVPDMEEVTRIQAAPPGSDSSEKVAPAVTSIEESPAEVVTPDDEKPLKKLRRFWWRKRPSRAKSSSSPSGKGEPTSGPGEA